MKIAELEVHHDACADLECTIRAMVQNREFPAVFAVCIASFEHIVPAISFRKKRGITPETPAFLAFTTIFRCAPPLFEHAVIESLDGFVRSSRVLIQHENDYLSTIEAARRRQTVAHKIWNHLESRSGALQRDIHTELGVSQEEAVEVLELWESLGIIDRRPKDRSYTVWFRTRLDVKVQGLCPECGVRGTARKDLFLKPLKCQRCGTDGYYHVEYDEPK